MAAVKRKQKVVIKPVVSTGTWIVLGYWALCALIYLSTDLFVDLYTTTDFVSVAWIAGLVVLPLTIYTLYAGRQEFFTSWYASIFFPLIVFGLYLGTAYFNALNLDLLASAAFKDTTPQTLPVQDVHQEFARKAGFVYTNVTLFYQGKPVVFQGTRTSFFLLKPYQQLHVRIGRSYLGNYYITRIQLPAHERWAARWAYLKDWFWRYVWLLIALPVLYVLSLLKDKFFPAPLVRKKPVDRPYLRFFRKLFIVLISLFGLFVLLLLLIGLFS
ncbi:hypothetical protein [Mucilaginibacter sp.]